MHMVRSTKVHGAAWDTSQENIFMAVLDAMEQEPILPAVGDQEEPHPVCKKSKKNVAVPRYLKQPTPYIKVVSHKNALSVDILTVPSTIRKLRAEQVLVEVCAITLSTVDLNFPGRYKLGDCYGTQGIGRVRLIGSKVQSLSVGDFVLPVLPVNQEGVLPNGAALPVMGCTPVIFNVELCAKIASACDPILSTGQMAVAKSLGAASMMVDEFAKRLAPASSVIVNAANGVVGQALVQLLALLGFRVFGVVQKRLGAEALRRKLENAGCTKVLWDDTSIREKLEELRVPLPDLAFDGIGAEATSRLVHALSKTGNIVCYGSSGGRQLQNIPAALRQSWCGLIHTFSLDKWLQEDFAKNTKILQSKLERVAQLLQDGRFKLNIIEYSTNELDKAVKDALKRGRHHAVVLQLPQLPATGEMEFEDSLPDDLEQVSSSEEEVDNVACTSQAAVGTYRKLDRCSFETARAELSELEKEYAQSEVHRGKLEAERQELEQQRRKALARRDHVQASGLKKKIVQLIDKQANAKQSSEALACNCSSKKKQIAALHDTKDNSLQIQQVCVHERGDVHHGEPVLDRSTFQSTRMEDCEVGSVSGVSQLSRWGSCSTLDSTGSSPPEISQKLQILKSRIKTAIQRGDHFKINMLKKQQKKLSAMLGQQLLGLEDVVEERQTDMDAHAVHQNTEFNLLQDDADQGNSISSTSKQADEHDAMTTSECQDVEVSSMHCAATGYEIMPSTCMSGQPQEDDVMNNGDWDKAAMNYGMGVTGTEAVTQESDGQVIPGSPWQADNYEHKQKLLCSNVRKHRIQHHSEQHQVLPIACVSGQSDNHPVANERSRDAASKDDSMAYIHYAAEKLEGKIAQRSENDDHETILLHGDIEENNNDNCADQHALTPTTCTSGQSGDDHPTNEGDVDAPLLSLNLNTLRYVAEQPDGKPPTIVSQLPEKACLPKSLFLDTGVNSIQPADEDDEVTPMPRCISEQSGGDDLTNPAFCNNTRISTSADSPQELDGILTSSVLGESAKDVQKEQDVRSRNIQNSNQQYQVEDVLREDMGIDEAKETAETIPSTELPVLLEVSVRGETHAAKQEQLRQLRAKVQELQVDEDTLHGLESELMKLLAKKQQAVASRDYDLARVLSRREATIREATDIAAQAWGNRSLEMQQCKEDIQQLEVELQEL